VILTNNLVYLTKLLVSLEVIKKIIFLLFCKLYVNHIVTRIC
jgi:hypothetical protein